MAGDHCSTRKLSYFKGPDRMPSDPNNPEVLTFVRTDFEASAIVAALASRGIEASTTGVYTAGFRAEAPGNVNVIVKYGDLDCGDTHLPKSSTTNLTLIGRK